MNMISSKFWPFLRLFTSCTFHLITNPNPLESPHLHLDILCNANFLNIQTARDFYELVETGGSNSSLHIDLQNVKIPWYRELSISKHQMFCNIDFFLIRNITNANILVDTINLKLEHQLKGDQRFYQPDFIFVATNIGDLVHQNIVFTTTFISSATIFFLNYSESVIYLACTTSASILQATRTGTYDQNYGWLLVMKLPIQKLSNEIGNLKSYKNVKTIFNIKSFEMSSRLSTHICPLGSKRQNTFQQSYSWNVCATSWFKSRINCSVDSCEYFVEFQFHSIRFTDIDEGKFLISHGSEFYGPIYTLFYFKADHRNMFSLLSPFTLGGWVIFSANCCFVGFVLWLAKVAFNPFYWVFTVILEQNDDRRAKINKASVVVVSAWLYVAFIFRQAYTSNLYSYMTIEKPPSDLPNTLANILNDNSVKLLTSHLAFIQLHARR